jgi:hypothetical protein
MLLKGPGQRLAGFARAEFVRLFVTVALIARRNCDVHDKELLAIMVCLNPWHCQILDNERPLEVITDHRNLESFQLKSSRFARPDEVVRAHCLYTICIRYRPVLADRQPHDQRCNLWPKLADMDFGGAKRRQYYIEDIAT